MTRFIYDQFSKDYLDELLSSYGKIEAGKKVKSEIQEIDLFFQPYSSNLPEELGLLGKMASHFCLFEPYRNPVTSIQIRACATKCLLVEAEIIREFNRQKKKVKEENFPHLWILTPTASQSILEDFNTKLKPDWGEGIYFCGNSWRVAIVVIHQLPPTPETLLLRLLGRENVQSNAIAEVEALSNDDPLKSIILEQLYNLQQNLFIQTRTETEDRELIMRLAPLYQQDRARAVQEGLLQGKQEGKQEGEANLLIRQLNRRFGNLSPELEGRIRTLPVEKLENLGEALFDFQADEDLLTWLDNNL